MMDAVTAVSGSGPAYLFLLAESMQAAAIRQGLPPDAAAALVVHTLLGSARMLAESGESAARLRERVTSPGGTTQAAIAVFEAGGFARLVADAIAAAPRRGMTWPPPMTERRRPTTATGMEDRAPRDGVAACRSCAASRATAAHHPADTAGP